MRFIAYTVAAVAAHGVAKRVLYWWSVHATRRSRARKARGDAADWLAVQTMADYLREGCCEDLFRELGLNASVIPARVNLFLLHRSQE